MSTIVISRIKTTEAYRADPTIADEGVKLVSEVEGVVGNYHGVHVEDPEVGVSVQVCTSPEAFMKVLTDKELYDKLCDSMASSRIGDPEHWCAVCVSDPIKALEGPYHQVSRLTLRNDTPEMKAKLEAMCAGQNKVTGGRMTYGWDVQDPKTVLVLISWESPEFHAEFASRPENAEKLKILDEIAQFHDGPFRHSKMTKAK